MQITHRTRDCPAARRVLRGDWIGLAAALLVGLLLAAATAAAQWTAVTPLGEAAGDRFGDSVAPAGDVNGDGYDDLIVGARNGHGGTGRAYVFFGGPTVDDVPDLVFDGENGNDRFGNQHAVAGGDLDGDGHDDLVVGACQHGGIGRVYVYLGGPAADGAPDLILDGEAGGDYFGLQVAVVGDVNADGFADFVVGAQHNGAGGANCGRAYLYHGGPVLDSIPDLVWTGEAAGDRFGASVSGTGDLDGDGVDDLAITAIQHDSGGSNAGRAYVYFMGATADATPDLVFTGSESGEWLGTNVAGCGDVNGDGHRDLIAGAQYNNINGPDSGRAYVYFLGPEHDLVADLIFDGETAGDHLGKDVAPAGDLNGDGHPDILLGVPYHDSGGSRAGRAYVHFGGPAADAVPDLVYTGSVANGELGRMVAGVGDLNGDGCDDFAITESGNNEAGANAGKVHIWVSDPEPAAIVGVVTSDQPTPGTPLAGVTVDVYDVASGDPAGGGITDAAGLYAVGDLAPGADYTVTVVTPLGYATDEPEVTVTPACGDELIVDFALTRADITAAPRCQAFWRRQVMVAIRGHGHAVFDADALCGFLDTIVLHFNGNGANPVVVYEPPASDLCEDKLQAAREALAPRGRRTMEQRANQQLMATLLNVAAGFISQAETISEDGATLSQFITHCHDLIDDPDGDHWQARLMAMWINFGFTLPADLIPLSTPDIAYRRGPDAGPPAARPILARNEPNPFNPLTRIRFFLPAAQPARLAVYGLDGRRIAVLHDGIGTRGWNEVVWKGADSRGRPLASGAYLYRLEASGYVQTERMLLLR